MATVQVLTKTDAQVALDEEAVNMCEATLRGSVIRPTDDEYDSARSIWNAMVDKHPAFIVRCAGPSDVIAAVNFAREHDLLLSVRGGGHNVAGNAVCDGGMVIDLSPMQGVRVDPAKQTATVQPGARWNDLDRETQRFGLATPGGIVSDTGIAGLTLGGGFGWLSRKHGFTCDNLIAADVVTADGDFVKASATENPELFWAIRGGGGNFGIVTSFEFRLHPVGPEVMAGLVAYRLEDARAALRFYREFAASAPRELGSMAVFRLAPPAPFIPEHLHGKPILGIIVCYAGAVEAGQRVLQPLKDFGQPIVDAIKPKPYIAHQSALDKGQPEGHQYYWKSEYLAELSDDAIETFIGYGADMSSPISRLALFQLGGAVRDVDEEAMAVSHRDAEFVLAINHGWKDPQQNEQQIQWTQDVWTAMQPFSTGGTYVNFQSADEGGDRVRAAYGAAKYQRLVRLKQRYDPANLFRLNQNITPQEQVERSR